MNKRILVIPVLALATALLGLGCGGSDDTTGTAASADQAPLSKAEFIKKADAICAKADITHELEAREYRERHEKELNKLAPIPAEEKLIRLIMLPSIRKQIAEVKALGAPKGEEQKVGKIIAGLEEAARKAEKDPYAIEGEVPTENPFRGVDIEARDYGFEECRNVT